MRTLLVLAAAVAAAPFGAPRAGAAVVLGRGDILLVDSDHDRILHVDPATGDVQAFSPQAGSGANLLDAPRGIAIDPSGPVFVVSSGTGRLIQIDPETGVQQVVQARPAFGDPTGPLDLGPSAAGLDIQESWPGVLNARDLFVGRPGEILRVSRGAFGSVSLSLEESDVDLEGAYSSLAVREVDGQLEDLFTTGATGFARYRFAAGTTYFVLEKGGFSGVDFADGLLVYARQNPCNAADTQSGVYAFDLAYFGTSIPLATAGLLACPTAVAIASAQEVYAMRGSVFPGNLIRVADTGATWTAEIAATLPNDAGGVYAMAIAPPDYLPEPGAAVLGAAALAALAARRTVSQPPSSGA